MAQQGGQRLAEALTASHPSRLHFSRAASSHGYADGVRFHVLVMAVQRLQRWGTVPWSRSERLGPCDAVTDTPLANLAPSPWGEAPGPGKTPRRPIQ
jgi:hypothetical protein